MVVEGKGVRVALVVFAAVLVRQFPMVDKALGIEVDAGMKPGAGLDRWHVEAWVVIGKDGLLAVEACTGELVEEFGIALIHPAKPTKLAFASVVIAVVILIGRHQLGFANVVDDLGLLQHLDRKRQVGHPGLAGLLICQRELGGGGVLGPGGRAHVVAHFDQKMGFFGAAEIEDFVITPGNGTIVIAPHQAGRARAIEIRKLEAGGIDGGGGAANRVLFTPTVPGAG